MSKILAYFFLCLFVLLGCSKQSGGQLSASASGLSVSVNKKTGDYTIQARKFDWRFKGSVGHALSDVKTTTGSDSLGSYRAIKFGWKADQLYQGTIRRYDDLPVVAFSLTTPHKAQHIKVRFPAFTAFPDSMYHFSYGNTVFAPPAFKLTQTSTPWLFFNKVNRAFILSPASDFMVSKMSGDGSHVIASGLNPELQNLPAHFTHQSVLVIGKSIHGAWAGWGHTLRAMYGRHRPGNESDPVLKYYGYWTDNGADYYYNYQKSKGYGGTLQAVKKRYKKEGLPMGYMQLDSWWYEKSKYDPNGKPTAGHKNHAFSDKGKWNRYGGLLTYRADKLVFPGGLKHFHQQIKIPLVVHNRWIDPHSPYHKKYTITGYAATDPHFWNDIAGYLKGAGVVAYEQDWLNYIYSKTPAMARDLSAGNAFTDGMAKAMQSHGLDMQYCMAMPRYFMQGVKYNNLTTIRTSGDRFEPAKWRHFLYTSQLAYSMGIWPWSDVFKSHETGNMIAAVLSAGVVGTGDALGHEDKANIRRAARTDGVLVKPDAPLLPIDSDYLHAAQHKDAPMLAATYTQQNNVRTHYVFAFAPKKFADQRYSFTPADLGMTGTVVVYDPMTGALKKMKADNTVNKNFSKMLDMKNIEGSSPAKGSNNYNYTYYIIAPLTSIGVGFLGDEGKTASTGRQRISTLKARQDELTVGVVFAKGETSIRLHGYYDKSFTTDHGTLKLHPDKHTFTLVVSASKDHSPTTLHLTPK